MGLLRCSLFEAMPADVIPAPFYAVIPASLYAVIPAPTLSYMASKRPYLSNPMCSEAERGDYDMGQNIGFEDAAHKVKGMALYG